jgi:NAD+ synthase (glutamine-hydrolysing)
MKNDIKLNKDLGYVRIGAAVPSLRIADIDFNVASIKNAIQEAGKKGVQILVFPEMSITGYTLGDMVQHQALLEKALKSLQDILTVTVSNNVVVILGMPLTVDQKLFNCAVVLNYGRILGVVPKTMLPDYKEFYESRWFSPAADARSRTIDINGQEVPFGTDVLFKLQGIDNGIIGIEICEDLWNPLSPHEYQALAGATILVNLSASNELLGKADWRRTMITSESGRCIAAYCYVSSGAGESSNDVVYGGHAVIAENGTILKETERLVMEPQMIVSDIDLDRLTHDRRLMTGFRDRPAVTPAFRMIDTNVADLNPVQLERKLDAYPFVPEEPQNRAGRCREIFHMQAAALAQKLNGSKKQHLVLGVSGGLDSTLALLAAVKAMDLLELPRTNVHAFSLPGFGTTPKTKANAAKLCRSLGVSFERVNIMNTAKNHLKDLKHNGEEDVVFENVQARYRTDFLFNKANQLDAILLGTGDLTEVALGWSTFSGDQMSHYHVNVSIPKTLVRYLVKWVADEEIKDKAEKKTLNDIIETPYSPELLPPENGKIVQKTEDNIGPLELADFCLYPFIRFGMRPGKILYLAYKVNTQNLFSTSYSLDELYKWLKSFINRFFRNQFKRTCMPEGPKIATVSLSPRGDWRMPSDAEPVLWLQDLEDMYEKIHAAN